MNVDMLRYLVELSNGEVDAVDVEKFYSRYPETGQVKADLLKMSRAGYLSVVEGDNRISLIGVNRKAIDYFRR
jgi:hypothetical protein